MYLRFSANLFILISPSICIYKLWICIRKCFIVSFSQRDKNKEIVWNTHLVLKRLNDFSRSKWLECIWSFAIMNWCSKIKYKFKLTFIFLWNKKQEIWNINLVVQVGKIFSTKLSYLFVYKLWNSPVPFHSEIDILFFHVVFKTLLINRIDMKQLNPIGMKEKKITNPCIAHKHISCLNV